MGSQTATLPSFSATFPSWVAAVNSSSRTSLTPSSFRFQVPPHPKATELNLLRFHRARTRATLDEKDPSPKTPLSVQESRPNRVCIPVNFIVFRIVCLLQLITCSSPVLPSFATSKFASKTIHPWSTLRKWCLKRSLNPMIKRAGTTPVLRYGCSVSASLTVCLSKRDHSVSALGSI